MSHSCPKQKHHINQEDRLMLVPNRYVTTSQVRSEGDTLQNSGSSPAWLPRHKVKIPNSFDGKADADYQLFSGKQNKPRPALTTWPRLFRYPRTLRIVRIGLLLEPAALRLTRASRTSRALRGWPEVLRISRMTFIPPPLRERC